MKTIKYVPCELRGAAMSKRRWSPAREDVADVCDVLTDSFMESRPDGGGYFCQFCGHRYPTFKYLDAGADESQLPHQIDCIILVARDIATGIYK